MSSCPKAMVHGPCGGVREDGSCEVSPDPCAFLDDRVADAGPPASGRTLVPDAATLLARIAARPFVVADLPSPALDVEGQRAAAAAVAGHVDAVLLGDAPWARVQLPPTVRARLVAGEGVTPWPVLTCRDRNAAALESELAGLAALGVAAVHCVTGDHPALGHRPGDQAVFALDAVRLAALACASGLVVSVAEAPAAPPVGERPRRAALKARAGARVCFVNHAGGLEAVAAFVAEASALAPELRFVACVPLATSARALERLAAFAGDGLPAGTVAAVEARDPVGAGVRATVAAAEALLAIPGIDGVDLSAPAAPGEELLVAGALALAGSALGGGT